MNCSSRFRVLASRFVFRFGVLLVFGVPGSASADVTKVTIAAKTVVADGQSFGATGPYEKLTGTIEFALDQPSRFRLTIHDVQGRLVRVLAEGDAPAGNRSVAWDGSRADGWPAACKLHLARDRDAPAA